jgi:peptidoglycan/LPS O-acetylase OafA/YrhL
MSFDARSRQDTRPVPAFLARRAFRIGPLFWSAAIFYLLWWGGIPSYFAPDGVHPWQVITTLLFVHGWTMESINAVVPGGWSIAVEMNFYLLLPLLRGWITTLTRALVAFVGSVVFAQVAAAVARRLFAESYASDGALFDSFLLFWLPRQLPVFFLGFATFFLLQRKGSWREQSWVKWLPELSLLLLVVLSTLRVPQQFTVMSCAFIPLVVGLSVRPLALFVNPVTRYLGKISFSSYLTHFVVVEWLEHAGMGQWVAQGGVWLGLRLACFYALAVGLAAVLATVTYRAIEVPGQNLGKRWLRWVGWEGSRPKVTEPRELASTR